MPDNISLDSCPFCGGDHMKITIKADEYHRNRSQYKAYARCLKCHARGPAASGDSVENASLAAADAWQWRLPEVELHL